MIPYSSICVTDSGVGAGRDGGVSDCGISILPLQVDIGFCLPARVDRASYVSAEASTYRNDVERSGSRRRRLSLPQDRIRADAKSDNHSRRPRTSIRVDGAAHSIAWLCELIAHQLEMRASALPRVLSYVLPRNQAEAQRTLSRRRLNILCRRFFNYRSLERVSRWCRIDLNCLGLRSDSYKTSA